MSRQFSIGSGPLDDAFDALATTMRGVAQVVAAIELLERQIAEMRRTDGPCPDTALTRAEEARMILVDLRRRISTARR